MTSFSDPFPRAVEATSEGTLPAARTAAVVRRGPAPLEPAAETATAPSPLEVTLGVLDDRWKTLLVWQLFWGARPFCELMRRLTGITKKRLRRELADMERHGLVRRSVSPEGNRKASYGLTPLGESLKPIVGGMYEWGLQHAGPSFRAPARPAVRAVRPPETPRAAVLRLLAEGPAKPRNV
ncbi:MAG TPA: helix-turn-helix domain-containing protein [Vicinamibacteria bacterium]|nr:helix-turn-helix domain-containing protein [Vicinamibacteria bacterium]